MEEIVYSLNLDLRKNTHQVLVMKEGDVNSRVIEAVITDNGKSYDLTNCAVNLKWKKPDGHVVYTDAEKIDYGTVKIVCSEQMLAVAGIIEAEFEIIDGSSVASTLKFTVSINETVIDGSVIESSDDFSALQSVVAHVGNDDVHIPSGGISGDTIIKNDSGHVTWGEITPVYTKAETLSELTSKEKLSVAFGKLAKAVADYISHKADKVAHITAEERTAWNAKLGVEKIAANLTTDADGMVLAAAMGKNLKEQIDTNANAISTLNSNKLTGAFKQYRYTGSITEDVAVEIATIGVYDKIISISLICCATLEKVYDGGSVYINSSGKLMYVPKSTSTGTEIRVSVITKA